jgi:L-aspartate oxidase
LVFGARAAAAMAGDEGTSSGAPGPDPAAAGGPVIPPEELRPRAWEALGLERDRAGLGALLADLAPEGPPRPAVRSRAEAEARNLSDVARAMAASALFREESRGGHFRRDFPERDDARFLGHTLLDADGPRLVGVESPVRDAMVSARPGVA